MSETGRLYIVATPIGNLDDMTFRAINTLKTCSYVACEDTRVTSKLLNYFDIDTPMVSYHQHSTVYELDRVMNYLRDGHDVALVSDAGYPIISDPGSELVSTCINESIKVTCIPGANAALNALVCSGLNAQHFYYYGFLNANPSKRKQELERLLYQQGTIIFYEAPHRIEETLKDMHDVLGTRRVVVARELTKKFEEIKYGYLDTMHLSVSKLKGEFVIVVDGYQQTSDLKYETSIQEQVDLYKATGLKTKEAIKKVAIERQMGKNEVYDLYHEQSNN